MKIASLVPGSAGGFYCQNCLRDQFLVRALRVGGHDALLVPLYLPVFGEGATLSRESPVFFGAVRVYLQERFPWLRRLPPWLANLLDGRPFLRFAARRAGAVRAAGLEELTLTMLAGEEGHQAEELDRLVDWLVKEVRPQVVLLANAMLMGFARRLKEALGVPIVCLLQDEHAWVGGMEPGFRERIWAALADRAGDVDCFVAVSDYYRRLMARRLDIQLESIEVIPPGVDIAAYGAAEPTGPPTIGFLSRLTAANGLESLVAAFLALREEERWQDLQLRAAGGWTGADKPLLADLRRKVNRAGAGGALEFLPLPDQAGRARMLSGLTLLSVPAQDEDAFGLYLLEAQAAGVPLVQPDRGGFGELIRATGGGVLYDPEDSGGLTRALATLLGDPQQRQLLGARGKKAVGENYTLGHLAENWTGLLARLL